ncbi:MAG: 4'-phosphopantetheinyl transferase superfamily protein [Deltaproteobacteria bacterium]|nr:4'-phosphopantetheinyl transferase superfamily protein [Deltaproteobacteria bacterium]
MSQPFYHLLSDLSLSVAEMAISQLPADAVLFPEEMRILEKAVEKRKREFSAGRMLARQAMEQLGLSPCAIGVGAHREPLWPEGIVGSITHCSSWCAAALGYDTAMKYVGIDVEDYENRTLSPNLVKSICVPEETRWLSTFGQQDAARLAMAVFSAKESLFKALFPVARSFLGFEGAQIVFSEPVGEQCTWRGVLRKDWGPFYENDEFNGGRCVFERPYVATAFVVAQHWRPGKKKGEHSLCVC